MRGAPLGLPVFTCEGVTTTWDDVVRSAQARGTWARLRDGVVRASAALADLDARGGGPGRAEVRSAATAFRRERRLVAADELLAWLDSWGLSTALWTEWIRGTLVSGVDVDAGRGNRPPPAWESLWTAAVCSGLLDAEARHLAEQAAAAAAVGDAADGDPVEVLVHRETTPQAVAAAVAAAGLDWTWLLIQRATFPSADAAAEAAHFVRADGHTLAEAAALTGVVAAREDWFLEDLPAPLRDELLTAATGEVHTIDGVSGVEVVVVRRRVPPSSEDPAVAARARAAVGRQAVDREVATRVRWHAVDAVHNAAQRR